MSLFNDDGHADHQGLITWDAGLIGRGDFYLYGAIDPENVFTNADEYDETFSVNNFGDVKAGNSLTVVGQAIEVPSTTVKKLDIQNLGPNGTQEFAVKQDSSINAFGLNNFYTASGARHTRYISTASAEDDLNLTANIVYCVNVPTSNNLIVTLPDNASTGDVITIIEVGGNLKYDTSLVLRTSITSGEAIQGDTTGTLIGGRTTPYPSGELVVQTPNAAFRLIYLGASDSNGQGGIPGSVRGWWLMEI